MSEIILNRIEIFPSVEYTLWSGSKMYQCGDCYRRSLTTSAANLPMRIGGFLPPADATCFGCGGPIVGRTDTIYDIVPPLEPQP